MVCALAPKMSSNHGSLFFWDSCLAVSNLAMMNRHFRKRSRYRPWQWSRIISSSPWILRTMNHIRSQCRADNSWCFVITSSEYEMCLASVWRTVQGCFVFCHLKQVKSNSMKAVWPSLTFSALFFQASSTFCVPLGQLSAFLPFLFSKTFSAWNPVLPVAMRLSLSVCLKVVSKWSNFVGLRERRDYCGFLSLVNVTGLSPKRWCNCQ